MKINKPEIVIETLKAVIVKREDELGDKNVIKIDEFGTRGRQLKRHGSFVATGANPTLNGEIPIFI